MTASTKAAWLGLILGAALLLGLWFYSVLIPRTPSAFILDYFSPSLVARSERYHRLAYLIWGVQTALPLVLLGMLFFTGYGRGWLRAVFPRAGAPVWEVVLAGVCLYLVLDLLTLPLGIYRGYFVERSWGFSQQTLGGWMLDWLKSQAINLVILGGALGAIWWLMGRWPRWWWLAGTGLIILASAFGSLLWPVLIDPWFNHFSPLNNPPLEAGLRALSNEAGLSVGEILVSDASVRTTKANAYFTGLGWTRRIVLYDTLLQNFSSEQVRLVVAHEIGHWRNNHIWKGLFWGALATLLGFALLGWLVNGITLGRTPWFSWREPALVVALLLFANLASFLALPLNNYFSRQLEREADAEVIRLTGNVQEWLETETRLSSGNLADFDPAPFVRWLIFTHPSPKERILQALSAERPEL